MAGINTGKVSTWNKNNAKLGKQYNVTPSGMTLGTQYNNITPIAQNTGSKGIVTDKVDRATILQDYPTSSGSSYGGGSTSSSVTAQNIYDTEREAYDKAYQAAVDAARTANAQDLKALSDYIERYRQDAATNRERLEKSYDTQASTLLKSIERFRENNAQNVADQRKAYLANQAALESARAEADRQSRIDAAARGLGGSGLAQLAQLQNLINQSQDISDAATENQSVMDKLRKALSEADTDYTDRATALEEARRNDIADLDTALARANEDYTTNVQKANDNLRDLLAQYEANRAQNNVGALSNLYSRVSSSRGGGGSSDNYLSVIAGGLEADQMDFQNSLANLSNMSNGELSKQFGTTDKSKIARSLYNDAVTASNNYLRTYGNEYKNLTNVSANNLKSILKSYGYSA